MNNNIDWKQHLKNYREFLQWDDEETTDYEKISQEKAKEALRNDLEFIIGTNGYSELYEREREYMQLLEMVEEV